MNGEISEALSDYAVSARFDALSVADQAHMLNAFVNWVGCAYGGSRQFAVNAAVQAYRQMSPHGRHASFGRTERFDLVNAVSLDCFSSAVQAFDDTHLETVLHPTGPVAAAALGVGRMQKVSGLEYLTALHLGMEIECRVGLAFAAAGSGAKSGWYATGLAGGIGAAAAVGRLLGFDKAQMKNAMGLAAARASGNRGTHGAWAASYVPSIAAESGLIAAMLTRSGVTCGARALDGPSGLLDLITDEPQVERALRGLGQVSEAARTAFKPYPAGIVLHQVIDACFELSKIHGLAADGFEHLTFHISPKAHRLVANTLPKTETEAQVSLYYWAAVTLAFGKAGVAELTLDNIADPLLQAMQQRMTALVDAQLGDDQCLAQVRLHDGRVVEVFIDHAVGSIDRPMSSADIDRKYLSLVAPVFPDGRAAQLLTKCRALAELDDVMTILRLGNGEFLEGEKE